MAQDLEDIIGGCQSKLDILDGRLESESGKRKAESDGIR